jgi:hypothetical protein
VVYEAFKLHNGTVGDVLLHNTVVKSGDAFGVYTEDPVSQLYSRNNLFIGGPGAEYGGYNSGSGDVIDLRSADDTCSLNYDGLGSIGTGTFGGRIGTTAFANQAELSSLTTETDAVLVDLSAFEADVILPVDPFSTPAVPSLLLSTNGSAVDRGIVLPNVNDGFTGDAPDLGAFEVGTKEPIYGPSGTLGEMPSGSGGTENAAAGTAGAATGAAGTSRSVGGASSDTGSGNTTGGASITSAGTSGAEDSASRDEGGCSCRASGDTRTNWPCCVLPLLLLGRRRRRMHPSYRFTRIRWWPWWRFGRFWP